MAIPETLFMTVSIDEQPNGLNLVAGFSPDDIPTWERTYYPHVYRRENGDCNWIIRSSGELSIKFCAMLTEAAEKSCKEAIERNNRRPVVNRE